MTTRQRPIRRPGAGYRQLCRARESVIITQATRVPETGYADIIETRACRFLAQSLFSFR